MTYVMLSRVGDLLQLFIIDSLPEQKFRTSSKCLRVTEAWEQINQQEPTKVWTKVSILFEISLLNCHSLLDNIVDIKSDQVIAFSDVICLTETWLKEDLFLQQELQIKGYTLHLNSFGDQKAKGLAMYYKTDVFHVEGSTKHSTIQVSKLSSDSLDVIGVYRSKQCCVGFSALINSDKQQSLLGILMFVTMNIQATPSSKCSWKSDFNSWWLRLRTLRVVWLITSTSETDGIQWKLM